MAGVNKSIEIKAAQQGVDVTNTKLAWPVRLVTVYDADGVVALADADRSVKPGESRKFGFAAPRAGTDGVTADVKLDLSGKHPFELFSLGISQSRTLVANMMGVRSARFPSEGTVGTGRYIDLRRSKWTIFYYNGDPKQPVPGPEKSFEWLSQTYPDWKYAYPIYGPYASELVLELYPMGDEAASPTVLKLPLPYSEYGQAPQDHLDLDVQKVQKLLMDAAGAAHPVEGRGDSRGAADKDK